MTAHIREYRGKHVHMIGIGGCSMSGLAGLLQQKGYHVTGSDRDASHKTEALEESGIPVAIGHRSENVNGADLVVYTAAIAPDNCERQEAERLQIPSMERATLLGQLMETYPQAIGVSGTHGKTTTTAMMSQAFVECGVQPTVHIGGELPALGGSTLLGGGDTFICEACEFNASFLQFHPTIAVVLNIDEDHLDFYKDIDQIELAFRRYVSLVPEEGWCVGCGDDPRVRRVMDKAICHTRSYGLEPFNELRAEQVQYDERGRAYFVATLFGHPLAEVQLAVPGEHNVLNALATIAVADLCQLPMTQVARTLSRFTGAHRRFELTGVVDGVTLYHDYGHNPTEIKNALRIAALQPHRTLWAVWQPHTYSRTKKLFDGFVGAFDAVDRVLMTDIYAAREQDPGDIRTEMLLTPMRQHGLTVEHTPSFDDTEAYLRAHWQPGDLVITLGCGNVDLLNEQIQLHGDTQK